MILVATVRNCISKAEIYTEDQVDVEVIKIMNQLHKTSNWMVKS